MKVRSATRLRVSVNGLSVIVTSTALLVVALVGGYIEFALIGVVGFLVLGLALLWQRVTSPIEFVRVGVPRLVGRGDEMILVLTASVTRLSPPAQLIDQMAGFDVPIALPEMHAGASVAVRYQLPAMRRGLHQLGPLLEERSDPLGLVTRTVEHDVTDQVLVHPIVHRLGLVEHGSLMRQSRARLARLGDDPLADFRSLREYVVGDDERLVHWPTVAKTGTLMVRDHFEARRTARTVVLDTHDFTISDALFEEAAEIAVSIVCESLDRENSVIVRTRDRAAPGRALPVRNRLEALELFSRVRRTPSFSTLSAVQLSLGRDPADQIFLVAGAQSPLIAELAANRSTGMRLVVIRLGNASTGHSPGWCLDVNSAREFVQIWNHGPAPT